MKYYPHQIEALHALSPTTRKNHLADIWRATHRDFKGKIEGVKCILVCRQGATVSISLDDLTPAEIADRLPTKK